MRAIFRTLPAAPLAYIVLRRARRTYAFFNSRRYPDFVYDDAAAGNPGVPVFTYHSIANENTPDSMTPAAFERQMRYLAENDYHTLSADELFDYLVYNHPVPPRSVMLTFDDGRATLWTVAFPILKKYGLRATTFLVPGKMTSGAPRPTLENYELGSLETAVDADLSDTPAITWDEARLMSESGLVEFQSHTLDHSLIYYHPQVIDFVHPHSQFGYANYGLPTRLENGNDHVHCRPALGTPIYRSQSRMSSARQFYDDEGLRQACQELVDQQSGEAFFEHPGWRDRLHRVVAAYRAKHTLNEYYETPEQQRQAIRHSLQRSKDLIEQYLPGTTVRHLCYPWHKYSILAASLALEVGYDTAFIATNPQKLAPDWNNPYIIQRWLPTNEYGDDPYQITRIDAGDDMVLSLPGKQRLSYSQRVLRHILQPPQFLKGWQR